VSDGSDIAFKVLHVDGIKADDGDVQADIRFCEFVAQQVLRFGKDIFETVEGFEERIDIILICLLSSCEPAFIDTTLTRQRTGIPIVNGIIDPIVDLVNLFSEFRRIISHSSLILRQQLIKLSIKHPNNLTRLIIHNRLRLLIPKHRNRISSLIIWVVHMVNIPNVFRTVIRVRFGSFEFIF